MDRREAFPVGASLRLDDLEHDPHPHLARLRATEPVSWVPALDGWLVTSYELAVAVMRDPAAFTVDDDRFSTAQVVGQSMLSLDGAEHGRHRSAFAAPFRPASVKEQFALATRDAADELIDGFVDAGRAELRRAYAGPLAASIIARALGFESHEVPEVLAAYDAIVGSVTSITEGSGATSRGESGFAWLSERLTSVLAGDRSPALDAAARELEPERVISNAAVLLFGGIETTEGMIANALLHLVQRPELLERVRGEAGLLVATIEESLRLEPAAAIVDRYATAPATLAGARIEAGELVRVSIAGANRDPTVFAEPDRFDLARAAGRSHLAFAQGPHVCLGVHLARLEARIGIGRLLERAPRLRADPQRPGEIRGLVFRKVPELRLLWE